MLLVSFRRAQSACCCAMCWEFRRAQVRMLLRELLGPWTGWGRVLLGDVVPAATVSERIGPIRLCTLMSPSTGKRMLLRALLSPRQAQGASAAFLMSAATGSRRMLLRDAAGPFDRLRVHRARPLVHLMSPSTSARRLLPGLSTDLGAHAAAWAAGPFDRVGALAAAWAAARLRRAQGASGAAACSLMSTFDKRKGPAAAALSTSSELMLLRGLLGPSTGLGAHAAAWAAGLFDGLRVHRAQPLVPDEPFDKRRGLLPGVSTSSELMLLRGLLGPSTGSGRLLPRGAAGLVRRAQGASGAAACALRRALQQAQGACCWTPGRGARGACCRACCWALGPAPGVRSACAL